MTEFTDSNGTVLKHIDLWIPEAVNEVDVNLLYYDEERRCTYILPHSWSQNMPVTEKDVIIYNGEKWSQESSDALTIVPDER